jgi:hypothetical protein
MINNNILKIRIIIRFLLFQVVEADAVNIFVYALPLGVAAKRSFHYICEYSSSFSIFFSPQHTFLPGKNRAHGAFMSTEKLLLNESN